MEKPVIKFHGHRIQDGKAIIDVKIWDGRFPTATWVGDAYELRKQLDETIEQLERKKERKLNRGTTENP